MMRRFAVSVCVVALLVVSLPQAAMAQTGGDLSIGYSYLSNDSLAIHFEKLLQNSKEPVSGKLFLGKEIHRSRHLRVDYVGVTQFLHNYVHDFLNGGVLEGESDSCSPSLDGSLGPGQIWSGVLDAVGLRGCISLSPLLL